MLRFLRATAMFATLAAALPVGAQQAGAALQVKTFDLHNLRPNDAAKLLSPYVQTAGGGVYDAGAINAITVRETPRVLAVMDSLLRVHDRAPASIVLRFQLIAARDSNETDARIQGLDAALRSLFRFRGYRLLAEGSTTAQESQSFALTMLGGAEQFVINGQTGTVARAGGGGSVRVNVSLQDLGRGNMQLLGTGVTIPIGQTVVLGSAAAGTDLPALILVVQPTLAGSARR